MSYSNNNIINNLKMHFIKNKRQYFSSLFILIITTLMTFWIFNLWNYDFNVPFNYTYGEDGMALQKALKGLYENGNLYINNYLGAPFQSIFYDYPMYGDTFHFAVLQGLSHIFKSYALAFNFYFFSLFPLTALISYLVMDSLKVKNLLSILGSVTFTFLYFRFLRGTLHYFLSAYTLIPVGILILLWLIIDSEFFNFNKNFFKNKRNYIAIITLIITGISGIYYAFFLCFFILIAILIRIINQNKTFNNIIKIFIKGGSLLAIVGITVIISAIPTYLNLNKYGASPIKTHRFTYEAEVYGLKIIQMFLPTQSHNIDFLQQKITHYNTATPMVNENVSAYLGIIGIIGFICLMVVVFINFKNYDNDNIILRSLCTFNIMAVLLATIGGFSSIFSLFISPLIRGYNRISVFIAYFCILAVCVIISKWFKKKNFKQSGKLIINTVCIVVFGLATLEQVVFTSKESQNNSVNLFYTHERFVQQIENSVPPESMIFQLPYQATPEQVGPNGMPDYLEAVGYLHSKTLRWSFGDYKGRAADEWVKQTCQLPTQQLVDKISFAGFAGIYIETQGYTSEQLESIKSELQNILGVQPIVSDNNELLFYNMASYNIKHKAQYSESEWNKKSQDVLKPQPTYAFTDGFYGIETSPESSWAWCDKNGSMSIINNQSETIDYTLKLNVATGYAEESDFTISVNGNTKSYKINANVSTIKLPIKLNSGENTINFTSNAQRIENPSDNRNLYFRIENFYI